MIAIFGGSFNPPTIAHEAIAKHVLAMPQISHLIFVPVGDSYEKQDLAPAFHRVAMLEALRRTLPPTVSVSRLEVDAPRQLKTLETLRMLQAQYPNERLAFIIGDDQLPTLRQWYAYDELLDAFMFFVLNRTSENIQQWFTNASKKEKEKIIVIENFIEMPVSATAYRLGDKEVVPDVVANYIAKHQLYA